MLQTKFHNRLELSSRSERCPVVEAKRLALAGFGVALAICAMSHLLWSCPNGYAHCQHKTFEGKSIRSWLREYGNSGDAEIREKAANVLKRFLSSSPDAGTVIAKAFDDKDAGTRRAALDMLRNVPDQAAKILPRLLLLVKNDESEQVRVHCIRVISSIEPEGSSTIPIFLQVLKDDNDSSVRAAALFAIRQAEVRSQNITTAVEAALLDTAAKVRMQAVHAFAELGESKVVVSVLTRTLLREEDPSVVQSVGSALSRFSPEAVPVLTKIIKDDKRSLSERMRAMSAVGSLVMLAHHAVPESRDAASWIAKFLAHDNVIVRRTAANALFGIGRGAELVLTDLDRGINDADSQVRYLVCCTIQKIGKHGSRSLPLLAKALVDEAAEVRQAASMAIGSFGTAGKPAAPVLIKVLENDKEISVRWFAVDALAAIGDRQGSVMAALEKAARDKDDTLRHRAIVAIETLTKKECTK